MVYNILKTDVKTRWNCETITHEDLVKLLQENALKNNDEITDERIAHSISEYLAFGVIEEAKEKKTK
jgi:hypothetical protein